MPVTSLGPFHHVGVAVKDIRSAAEHFASAFGAQIESEIVHDPLQKVRLQFMRLAGLRIELLEPAADPSPLDTVLKRGLAIYHVCHEVGDLDAELARMSASGAAVISPPKPAVAFDGRRVAFVMCDGFMLELLESTKTEPNQRHGG